jgi:NitT/TauT family transport system substrate-binding protein
VISRKVRIPAAAGVAVALAIFAAGCGSGGTSSTITATNLTKVSGLEKTTLNVAAVPAMDSAGFFVALHEGLFADEGLTINYTPATSSATAIQSQVEGKFDITAGNYVSYIQAQAENQYNLKNTVGGLEIVSEGSIMEQGSQVILTLPQDHINSLQDLVGKTVAVNAPLGVDQMLLDSTLTDADISTSSVHLADDSVTGVPFPDMAAALKKGSFDFSSIGAPGGVKPVDAVVVPEPFASEIETGDDGVILDDMNAGATTEFPIEGYVVTKKWAQENPNTLQAFLNALEAGQEIADTDRTEVEQAFETIKGGPPDGQVSAEIASMMALNTYPVSIDVTRLERVVDVMLQFGALPKSDSSFNINTMLASGS